MGMNQLYSELEQFIHVLGMFNESTAKNWDELHRAWEHAAELWNDDATRQQFEREWQELGTALRLYREKHGDQYEEFLLRRKWALDEYFGRR
jgi:hypothetical protein